MTSRSSVPRTRSSAESSARAPSRFSCLRFCSMDGDRPGGSQERRGGATRSAGDELLERESRLRGQLLLVEVSGDDVECLLDAGNVQVAEQVAHVVDVVELGTEPHRQAFHGEQVLRARNEDAQVGQLEVRIEL